MNPLKGKRPFTQWNIVLIVLSLAFFACLESGQAADYDLILLEPPGVDVYSSEAYDINEFGHLIGSAREIHGPNYGFFYDATLDEYWLPGEDVYLHGINNLGEMIGDDFGYYDGLADQLGFYWPAPGAEPIALPPLPGDEAAGTSPGKGINDAGLIGGWSWLDGPLPRYDVVVWKASPSGVSAPLVLPRLSGDNYGLAEAIGPINANGVATVAGWSGDFFQNRAVRWKVKIKSNGNLVLKEGPIDLGSLGDGEDSARSINVQQFLVGVSGDRAFKKTKNGTMRSLKQLKFKRVLSVRGDALDVNDHKDIVGGQSFSSGWRAVLWVGGKQVIDLNTRVDLQRRAVLKAAIAINNTGEMAVNHENRLGYFQAGILIPKP